MKNFPTKTFASRRNKKAAQGHKSVPTSGPRGQAGGPGGGGQACPPRGEECKAGDSAGRRDTHKRWGPRRLWAPANAPWEAGLRGPRGSHAGAAGSWGSRHPARPLLVCIEECRAPGILPGSQFRQVHRKEANPPGRRVNGWQPVIF